MSRAPLLRRRRALVSALAVGVVAVVFISVLATRGIPSSAEGITPLGGKVAPPISGTDLLSGKRVTLSALRGKYVVVDFFASWCAPCQADADALEAFQFTHHGSGDATILGVVFGDSASNAAKFLRSSGSTWPAVTDPGARFAISYGVSSPSQIFVVAPNGRVIPDDENGQVSESTLNGLLAATGGGTT